MVLQEGYFGELTGRGPHKSKHVFKLVGGKVEGGGGSERPIGEGGSPFFEGRTYVLLIIEKDSGPHP